ncbi:thiamine phosphate synthase [Flavobacterium sp. F372]|uniref:Thiamine phosphate synthase n=1 Tax=Flavobacterium bernardetii TaxID=2813823 RepID=A0ABR7IVE4_9FLAO|nr:thiamine phosphate synthase [Flavobacterium bernardetii]MBC5833477.1 thiamine phosphate synthase [Flavobacterium bernardetii]NHF68709.1 thiamine phosphate synthase [Flavobacterium bernardetii]
MIVITNPFSIENEFQILHQLFEEGLALLHVRKPTYSEKEMRSFLTNIDENYRSRIVLHKYHKLAEEFQINRIHFYEKEQVNPARFQKPCRYVFSTSTHNMTIFNDLKTEFYSAFLSPVFPSISKPNYKSDENLLETISKRTNFNTKLVALGGINENNIKIALDSGFDDVALLGCIWLNDNPIQKFKKCQKIVHSY